MLKWISFLVLLGLSVAIFIFAPLGLVGYFVSRFTPAGLEWVGEAFAIGLSLSVVANAFLARWKSMKLTRVWLGILAVSEGAMSGATFYTKALADGSLDLVIAVGILAIVAVQEAVLISGGMGMANVLDKIGEERRIQAQRQERRAERQRSRLSPTMPKSEPADTTSRSAPTPGATPVTSAVTTLSRPERLDAIRRDNAARNGKGPMTPDEVVAKFGVGLRQAQRDVAEVAAMTPPALPPVAVTAERN